MSIYHRIIRRVSAFYCLFKQITFAHSERYIKAENNVDDDDFYNSYFNHGDILKECHIVFRQIAAIEQIEDRIEKFVILNKAFLDPDLKMEKVAREVGTNRTYISTAMKSKNGFNFFINAKRIQYMAGLLKDDSDMEFEDAIFISGFKSKRSFQNVLREHDNNEYAAFIKKRYLCEQNELLI